YGFLAMLVGYLPALYAAYSQREASIAVLYARAGTAPTAAALLEQVGRYESPAALSSYLTEWELWLATLLETHLSHSSLLFYRSQEADQSWLGVLTLVLDVSALVCVGIDGVPSWTGQRVFRLARRAAVQLSDSLPGARANRDPGRPRDLELAVLRRQLAAV